MTGTTAYEVGPPRLADADTLGRVHVAVWRATYAGLMSPQFLAEMDVDRQVTRWREIIGGLDGSGRAEGRRTLVARTGGAPVGWVTAGTPHDVDPPAPVQLWALNVAVGHQGRGIGRALVAAAVPDGPAYLWVLRGNERAIGFYRTLGFELDGTTVHEPAFDGVELRMTRT